MGFREAILAGALVRLLANFVVPRNLGHVAGAGRHAAVVSRLGPDP